MDAFWPGPLTLILKRAPHIADTVSGRQDSIGLRCPSHPVAQALLAAFAAGKPNGRAGWRRRRPISSGRSRRRWPSTCARNSPTRSRPACRCWKAGRPKWASNPPSWTCRGWTRAPVPCCCVPAMSAPRRSRRCWARRCSRPTRPRRLGHAQGALRAAHRAGTGRRRARGRRPARHRPALGPGGAGVVRPRRPRPMPACNGARCRPIRRATRRRCTRCCELDAQGYARIVAGAARQRRMACGQRPHRPRRRRLHARYLRPVVFGQSRLAGMRPERRCASHGRLAAFPGLASGLAEPTGISSHLLDRASLLSRGDEGGNFNQGK